MKQKHTFLWSLLGLCLMLLPGPIQASGAAGIGDLVKCPDASAVYYIGEDGKRHAFANEQTYISWYMELGENGERRPDFEGVKTISCDDLATLSLGDPVTYQAGTRLLKMPSVPTVYVVEPGGELRAIESEEQARALHGDDWNQHVDDLPETFFTHYDLGDPLAEGELPEGKVVRDGDELYRVNGDGQLEQFDHLLDDEDQHEYDHWAVDASDIEEKMKLEFERLRADMLDAVADFEERMDEWMSTVAVDEHNRMSEDDFERLAVMSEELEALFEEFNEKLDMHKAFDVWEEVDNCPDAFVEAFGSCDGAEEAYDRVDRTMMASERLLDEAMERVHDEEWSGKRTDGAWRLIDSGWNEMDAAWQALDIGWEIWNEEKPATGSDILRSIDKAEEHAAEAAAIAARIMSGEGVEAVEREEWNKWREEEGHEGHEEWCDHDADCWWEDGHYDDDAYWDEEWDKWHDDCASRGDCDWEDERPEHHPEEWHEDFRDKWDEDMRHWDEEWDHYPDPDQHDWDAYPDPDQHGLDGFDDYPDPDQHEGDHDDDDLDHDVR